MQWTKQATKEGDGLKELVDRYRRLFSPGLTDAEIMRQIVTANGIKFSNLPIDSWVFSLSHARHPWDAKSNPGVPPGAGWAYFKEGNMILLPAADQTKESAEDKNIRYVYIGVGLLALAVVGGVVYYVAKKT